jgi:hypothetical protein
MCGARLTDDNELDRHNELMHPNMAGKKGGAADVDVDVDEERKPDRDRPID